MFTDFYNLISAETKGVTPSAHEIPNRLYGGRSNTLAIAKNNGPPSVCSNTSEDDHRSMGSK